MTGSAAASRIELCGNLAVTLRGERVDARLGGRQGRLLFAYLAVNRARSVGRGELLELLWPEGSPENPDAALRTSLSRLRSALSSDSLTGREALVLKLPDETEIDLEELNVDLARAERALASGSWPEAHKAAASAAALAARGFCLGLDGPWIESQRAKLEESHFRALECVAEAGLALGEPELTGAAVAAREVIAADPLRESGQRLLMEALARRGNVAEALGVYDDLRRLLRDELGTVPGARVQELHSSLLRGRPAAPAPRRGAWVIVNPGTPREWTVELDDVLLAGRECERVEPSRRLVLDDPTVSREHLELRREPSGDAVLVDLSTNGTRINGQRVPRGHPQQLGDGDEIGLGSQRLVFRAPAADRRDGRARRTTLRH